jgi:hypothetical protein
MYFYTTTCMHTAFPLSPFDTPPAALMKSWEHIRKIEAFVTLRIPCRQVENAVDLDLLFVFRRGHTARFRELRQSPDSTVT